MTSKRVVITGLGPVTAAGIGREAFFAALAAGRSGIGELTLFDPEQYGSRLAAELPPEFKVEDYLRSQKTYLDRASELAFAAMSLALTDSGLNLKSENLAGIGLTLGTAAGSLGTATAFYRDYLEKGPRLVKPVLFPNTYSNTAISLLAIEYGIAGPHLNFASGFISSACALTAGFDLIRQGRAEVIFAGGVEALSETLYAGCARNGQLSPGPDGGLEICAPFDSRHNGFILGEGAAILVLEELEHARQRHATIYGEFLGAGLGSASLKWSDRLGPTNGNEPLPPLSNGLQRVMELACRDADLAQGEISWILAHADGLAETDRQEARAIATLLGTKAAQVPVTSIKPLTGEIPGAGAALQVVAALGAAAAGTIPPVLNLVTPDAEPGLSYVSGSGLQQPAAVCLLNSIDPGGGMISLVLRGGEITGA